MENNTLRDLFDRSRNLWIVKLAGNQILTWEHSQRGGISILGCSWNGVEQPGTTTRIDDMSIQVAQSQPLLPITEVKAIASTLLSISKMKKGDAILGLSKDNRIESIGVVLSLTNDSSSKSTRISVEWIHDIVPFELRSNPLKSGAEIRKVSGELRRSLPSGFDIQVEEFAMLKKSAVLYAPLRELSEVTVEKSSKTEKGGILTIFYGTNRGPNRGGNTSDRYSNELTDDLLLGTCQVSIPRGHQLGELERPLNLILFSLRENDQKHVVLKAVNELAPVSFGGWLSEALGDASQKSALIFVHGFNTNFDQAARRTAQLAWDLPFDGVSGFFSWPAGTRALDYGRDIECADASAPAFERFLDEFVIESGVEQVHLIAHSMGSRLLLSTLNSLYNDPIKRNKLGKLKHVVLGAPDIDQAVFKNAILPAFKNVGSRRTLYSSDKDEALRASTALRDGLSRLGYCGSSLFVDPGLDTIDASNIESRGFNHSYLFEAKELLNDLYYMLKFDLNPEQRRLRAMLKGQLPYWLFPE